MGESLDARPLGGEGAGRVHPLAQAADARNVAAPAAAGRLVAQIGTLGDGIGRAGYPPPHRLAAGLSLRFAPLAEEVRLVLAAGALMALDDRAAEELAEAVLADLRRGAPPPPFTDVAAEARLWAAWASPDERRAYAAATLHRLSPRERRAVLAAVEHRAKQVRGAARDGP